MAHDCALRSLGSIHIRKAPVRCFSGVEIEILTVISILRMLLQVNSLIK